MRDSINYNLNYFIMRKSGTKPMKNTMRKPPIKQVVGKAVKTTETSVKSTKPSSTSVKSSTETSAKAPTMQMKKSGMGKKC